MGNDVLMYFLKNSIPVWANSEQEADDLLRHCEHLGLRWASGDLPTKWRPGHIPFFVVMSFQMLGCGGHLEGLNSVAYWSIIKDREVILFNY